MINFFQFASNDNSLQYLAQIFGYMNGVIPIPAGGTPGGATPSGTTLSLLGEMFRVFNGVVLVVGTLVIVYTTVVGIIQTAHEGEFMGKKWNNVWIPIRMVLGIIALVPTGSGYSGVQIVMMWIIVQGIGAADTLWTTALTYVNIAGSPYAQTTIPNVNTYQVMDNLFKAAVCDAATREARPDPSNGRQGAYYCNKSVGSPYCNTGMKGPAPFNDAANPILCTQRASSSTGGLPDCGMKTYSYGPNGMCGTLTYCDGSPDGIVCRAQPDSLACKSCKAQANALSTIVPTINKIAYDFVQADYQYRDFYANSWNNTSNASWSWIYDYCRANNIPQNQCCYIDSSRLLLSGGQAACQAPISQASQSTIFPPPNMIDASGNVQPQNPSNAAVTQLYWPYALIPTYSNSNFISDAVTEYMTQLGNALGDYIQTQVSNQSGLSGQLSDAQQKGWIQAGSYYYTIANMNTNNLGEAVPPISMASQDPSQNDLAPYRTDYSAAGQLMAQASGNTESAYANLPGGIGNEFGNVANSAASSVTQAFSTSLQNTAGVNPLYQMSIVGSVFLTVAEALFLAVVSITIGLGLSGSISIFVLGSGAINPVTPTATLLYMIVAPLLFGLMGLLITIGGTLGIYVPLIPYVIFAMGAIGWMISTIEAMVAGPLIALAILSPSGQHEVMGKAEPAIMLLFNIFLRPSLMIFGLMAAMLLAIVVVGMINSAFYTVMTGIKTGSAVLAWTFFLCAYVTLIIASLNKCFALIHIIPERTVRWIGGQAESEGAAEALSGVKGGVEAGVGGGKAGAGEAKGAGEKTAISAVQQKEEKKKTLTGSGGNKEEGG